MNYTDPEPHERLMPGWWWYSLPVDDRRTISGSVYHLRNFDLSRLSTMRTRTGSFSAYARMISYRQRDADTRRKILDTLAVLPLRQAARAAGQHRP